MTTYFSTFITGFDKAVEIALIDQVKNVKIELLTDGLIIYKTDLKPAEILDLKFVNNSFILLRKFNNVSEDLVNEVVKKLIKNDDLENDIKMSISKRSKFRIRASIKNQFVSIDKNLLRKLEEKITHSVKNLTVDRSLPEIELLVTIRSEGFGLAGIQISKRPNYEKTLEKGELYPELAYILCLISEPKNNDVFLDPFSGHGSIPAQRLSFTYKRIIAVDNNKNLLDGLKNKFGKKVLVKSDNALKLNKISNNSVDKIVTDPPWGLFENNTDIRKFYHLMLEQLIRVLKQDGLMVVLTYQKEIMEDLIKLNKGSLELEEKYNTLVSEKKAGVYKIRKI